MASKIWCIVALTGGIVTATKPRPHIIHIMVDDLGWNDLGFKQAQHHEPLCSSPNIDRLATTGVLLTSHYAFKVCGPSRSSFHTGRLPWQMGYYDNSGAATPFEHVDSNRLGASRNFTLLPEVLQAAGYKTHAIGKWHLGHVTRAYTPTYRGYETFLGYYSAMTHDYWAHTHATGASNCKGPGLDNEWSDLSNNSGNVLAQSMDNGTYESTLFGDQAVSLINNHAATAPSDKPLFIYLAFHNEHDPHQAPKSAIDKYENTVKSDTYKVTCAQISTMDEQIGRVVEALNKTGMLSNSVIGLSSDNGGPLDHANNYPRRGGKHTFYEGDIRTTAFMWSPLLPKSRQGTKYKSLMHLADWRSTYAMGVAAIPREQVVDAGPFAVESQDHWAAISGSMKGPRTEIIHAVHSTVYPGNCSYEVFNSRNCPAVITSGDLKLMLGAVGDRSLLTLNESAAGKSIPFGQSGGFCGLAGFAERCESEGNHKAPASKADDPGGCLHGCLFNVTGDISESTNLFNDPSYASDVQQLTARLQEAGAIAPAWFQAPEVIGMTDAGLKDALCQAAREAGGVQPIDFSTPVSEYV